MFGMGKKKKERRGEERKRFDDLPLRDDIPQPKGKFRNMFEEWGMMPESMKANSDAQTKTNTSKSE